MPDILADDGYNAALGTAYITATQIPVVSSIDPATGLAAGGTPVTLTGLRFTGSTGVLIGGVGATSVVVVDDTTITAVTPAGTVGAKNVIVQHPFGNSDPLVDGFTYT